MEIRHGEIWIAEFIELSICTVASLFFWDGITILVVLVHLLWIPTYLYCFRRFRMDETGVHITYLGYIQRHYPWNSFVVKQLVQPPTKRGIFERYSRRFHSYHRKPVLLSLKPIIDYPTFIKYEYLMWHPLSCVFIGFDDEFPKHKLPKVNAEARERRGFEVNREEFVSKMKEWGVEIKGLTDQQE